MPSAGEKIAASSTAQREASLHTTDHSSAVENETATSYLVYEYGCLPPRKGREAAMEQMWLRHRLWNSLVEIERTYRTESLRLLRDDSADGRLEEAKERLNVLRTEIKARRQAARRRTVPLDDLQEAIARTKFELTQLAALAKEGRRLRIAQNRSSLDSLEATRRLAVKRTRQELSLYWCNYDDVLMSYETARKRALKEGRELRFQSWDGSGRVTVRYQQGLRAGDIFGTDTRLQIDSINPLAWTSTQRSIRRKLSRSTVRIRVASAERAPVWLELPVVIHRPLPQEGVIRRASVVRDKVGTHERWRLLITVEQPAGNPRTGPSVGVDIGWRLMPDGLRVAYWEDEAGRHDELLLSNDVLWQFSKLDDLRSIQDQHRQTVLYALADWSAENTPPEWMDLDNVSTWKNPRRLLRLYGEWHQHRFSGDKEIFWSLAVWKERYDHLHEWETNLRDQVLRHRKEIYRRFIADLLKTHGRIFLEDFDLRVLAGRQEPEKDQQTFAGNMRVVAATSILRRAIEAKGGCSRVPAGHTTQMCSACGFSETWDAAKSVIHICHACGAMFDQDRNAARNILRRGLERELAGYTAEPSSGEVN